ncbi:MAG: DUF2130 domain-containing protein [Saprospiraceae bacterium]|nr:DUF2130 domain-containing protein [Saprospiraceae bacterium]
MTENQKITCPNCSHVFAVEDVINKELQARLQAELDKEKKQLQDLYSNKEAELEKAQKEFEEKKKRTNEIFQEKLNSALEKKEEELTKKVRDQMDAKMKFLEEEREKQSREIATLRSKEVEMMKKEAELKEKENALELRIEKELLEKKQAIEAKARNEESERSRLKMKEYEKRLEDLTKQLHEAQRRAEQGSTQLQGEVQELVLEDELSRLYPFDVIDEVPKGHRGADVIQKVRNDLGETCGTIIIESKRTKSFGGDWIEKLKADQRELGANIPLLITQTMPKELDRFGQLHGVWICTFKDWKSVMHVLREMLIKMNSVKSAQTNKGDKMEVLYDFLTGPEFKGQLQAIVEGFITMQEDINKERRAMERLWKSREKQIDKVLINTTQMYGSIRGIAGNAIGTIKQLELPDGEDEEEDEILDI